MLRADGERGRVLGAAARLDVAAARREPTARRQAMQRGRLPLDRGQALDAAFHARDGRHQRFGIGMPRRLEERAHRTALHDPPGVHDGDAVAHPGDDPEVVRDEEHRQPHPRLQLLQQHEVLELDRDVERGGGLVRDQELRLRGERDRADHALLHAAAHLMRERAQALLGRRHLHAAEGVHRPRPHVAPALGAMGAQRLLDLVADREHRVQRGLRVLQDHRDAAPAHPAHVALALRHEVLAFEEDLALHDAARRAGSRRSNDSAVMVLPEPDSPTSPSVSPARIAKLTPSTAFTRPQRVLRCAWRSLTSRT